MWSVIAAVISALIASSTTLAINVRAHHHNKMEAVTAATPLLAEQLRETSYELVQAREQLADALAENKLLRNALKQKNERES